MLFWTIVKIALRSIVANRLRSVLTILGIVIGVASVIAMLAIGDASRRKVTEQMQAFGANLLSVRPDWGRSGGVRTGEYNTLKIEHAEAILRRVPEVDMVSPDLDGSYQVKYLNRNNRVQINGEAPTYFTMRNFAISTGRIFSDQEVADVATVAVIGPKIVEDLFQDIEPLGEEIKINGINFLVIGVTAPKDERSDDNIWVPYTTCMKRLTGQEHLDQVYARVREGADAALAQENIRTVMREMYRLQPEQPDNFRIFNRQEAVDSMDQVGRVFMYLLGGVAGISLLVGGINIMNIMLVSVTERTREIGVRKALGARRRDLMNQFLLEAATVSLMGGAAGIALGYGIVHGLNYGVMRYNGGELGAAVAPWTVLLSFGFSAIIGVFFGWYPARRAALMDPIDALRHE